MNKDQVVGVVTTLLTAFSGFLVTKGYIDQGSVTTVIGAIGTLVGVGWQIVHHSNK